MGDCGLELCIFSSDYKVQEEKELTVQQKRDYRKWKSERKRLVRDAGLVDEPVVDGLGGGGIEEEVEEQDVNTSSESTISHQEQGLPDTASTTHDPITPTIPTSPKAGQYAKGSRLNRTSASPPVPTSSTLKRKSCVTPSRNPPTPVAKRPKTGSSASVSSLQTMTPGSVVPVLSKSAMKRLRQQAKKASQKAHGKPQETNAVKLQSGTEELDNYANPLDIVSNIPSSISTSHTTPPYTSLSHAKPSKSKPSQQTCFMWYHDSCPKKGKKCADLHALTDPPSYVVAPGGYVHEGEVCGRDWCAGDWRGEDEEDQQAEEYQEGWEGEDEEDKIESDDNAAEADVDDEDEIEEQGHEQFTEEERDKYWDYKSVDSCSIAKEDSAEIEEDAASEG
jgi:hypothetical protein